MELKFHTLDVFTETRFGGNPLAVVLGADDLDGHQMQTIAAEFNLSETVFVQKPERLAHSAKLRIFTPKAELPFAGHPTVGTAALLAELRAVETDSLGSSALVILEEGVGPVRVGVRVAENGDEASYAEFDGPKLPVMAGDPPATEDIAQAINLIPGEIGFANHRPMLFDGGSRFLFVPVATRDVLKKAAPNLTYWRSALGDAALGVFAYCNSPEHVTAHYRARVFAPDHGIMEDPATGSAAAGFAGVIQHFDRLPAGMHKRRLEQGYEMGRPSNIDVALEVGANQLSGIRIGGYAVRVSEGSIKV